MKQRYVVAILFRRIDNKNSFSSRETLKFSQKWVPLFQRPLMLHFLCRVYSLVSHGTVALNVSSMEKIRYRNSPSVVVRNYFP